MHLFKNKWEGGRFVHTVCQWECVFYAKERAVFAFFFISKRQHFRSLQFSSFLLSHPRRSVPTTLMATLEEHREKSINET